jgi:early secretory antigenic target protein ESAT-6
MMSIDSIYVNYSGVSNVLDELTTADSQIQAQLTELQQQIQPLRATWSGTSEQEYEMIQAKWNTHLATMQGILNGPVRNTLNEMQINYAQTDNGLAAQWQAIP